MLGTQPTLDVRAHHDPSLAGPTYFDARLLLGLNYQIRWTGWIYDIFGNCTHHRSRCSHCLPSISVMLWPWIEAEESACQEDASTLNGQESFFNWYIEVLVRPSACLSECHITNRVDTNVAYRTQSKPGTSACSASWVETTGRKNSKQPRSVGLCLCQGDAAERGTGFAFESRPEDAIVKS